MEKKADRIHIVPQWEHRGAEAWTIYAEDQDGQVGLIGTVAVGPFDTVGSLVHKVVRCLVDSGWQFR